MARLTNEYARLPCSACDLLVISLSEQTIYLTGDTSKPTFVSSLSNVLSFSSIFSSWLISESEKEYCNYYYSIEIGEDGTPVAVPYVNVYYRLYTLK